MSYVWAQHDDFATLQNLLNNYNVEDIWIDRTQDGSFNPKAFRKQYETTHVLVCDTTLINIPKEMILLALKLTEWGRRGWTYQEMAYSKNISILTRYNDIKIDISFLKELCLQPKDEIEVINVLHTRYWSRQTDYEFNIKVIDEDFSMKSLVLSNIANSIMLGLTNNEYNEKCMRPNINAKGVNPYTAIISATDDVVYVIGYWHTNISNCFVPVGYEGSSRIGLILQKNDNQWHKKSSKIIEPLLNLDYNLIGIGGF